MSSSHDELPEELQTWIKSLESQRIQIVDVSLESRTVQGELQNEAVQIGVTPDHWCLALRGTDTVREVSMKLRSAAPERITLNGWPNLKKLSISPLSSADKPRISTFEFELIATAEGFEFDDGRIPYLELIIRNGSVKLGRNFSPQRLTLVSAGVQIPLSIPTELSVGGDVQLPAGFSAVKTRLLDKTTISRFDDKRKQAINLGHIYGDPNQLIIKTHVAASQIPQNIHIEGYLQAGEATATTMEGDGTISIRRGNSLTFRNAEQLTLRLRAGDVIDEASGVIGELDIQDATLTGARSEPLAPRRITNSDQAELHDVDLSRLEGIGSLGALRSAHLLSPSRPRGFSQLLKLGSSAPAHLSPSARQVFWAQLVDIVKEKRARGAVQSALRFVSAHARMKAAPTFSGEKAWLSVYRLFRYGEGILAPFLWHLVFTGLVVLGVIQGVAGLDPVSAIAGPAEASGFWLRLLVLPLSFFRLTEVSPIQGGDIGDFVTVFVRVEGLLMIYFSLAAIRRLTKAE